MNTIKTHKSNNTKITITKVINGEKYKETYKGYTIGDIPNEYNHWFNYKGLTYIIS